MSKFKSQTHHVMETPELFRKRRTEGFLLGQYRVVSEAGGVNLPVPLVVRDRTGWQPGTRVLSRTGRAYSVDEGGALVREKTKIDARTVRHIRRSLTRRLKAGEATLADTSQARAFLRMRRKEGCS